ncbi:RING-H2 finger protein ATL63 [Hirschfeldia incana]|nr:RING-H2 finger protein ATL63 [Hirschfeldia incana]
MMEGEGEEGSMTTRSSLSSFLKVLSSYNSNVLLAALVFLLLVVLFVLLLHFYARFFWSHSDQEFSSARRRRRRRRRTVTRIIPPVPLEGLNGGVSPSAAAAATNDDKGLDSSVISSIPLFVYEDDDNEEDEEECVICLGLWEAGDFGRKLRYCGHGFHVECIDMWLSSHSTCPLCRSPVLAVSDQENIKPAINGVEEEEEESEVTLQMFPAVGGDENVVAGDRRYSLSCDVMEDDVKAGVDDEGEVRIDVLDEEINSEGSRGDRRSTSSVASSASSSLMRMLSSRSRPECSKVFPSATTQDSSP